MSAPDDAPKSALKIPLAQGAVTHVAQISLRSSFPFPLTDSSHALSLWRSEGREAVQDCRPDLQFGDLPVKVARHDALTEQLEAPHLGLDQASSVIPAPSPPDRAAEAAGGADGVVQGLRAGGVFQLWARVLAGGYDGAGVPRRDGGVAAPRVIRAVRSDLADGLVCGNLVQQFGQHPSPVRSNRWRLAARHRRLGCRSL